MVDQLTLQTYSIILTGIGMVIALTYYSLQIRNQNRNRRLQIVKEIWDWISTEEGYLRFAELMTLRWTDFDDHNSKYGSTTNPEAYAKIWAAWNRLNGLGYMVKEGAIDAETVYDHSGGRIVWMWRKYGPIVKEMRASHKISYICKWWEYLVGEMETVSEERGDKLELPEVWRTD